MESDPEARSVLRVRQAQTEREELSASAAVSAVREKIERVAKVPVTAQDSSSAREAHSWRAPAQDFLPAQWEHSLWAPAWVAREQPARLEYLIAQPVQQLVQEVFFPDQS